MAITNRKIMSFYVEGDPVTVLAINMSCKPDCNKMDTFC